MSTVNAKMTRLADGIRTLSGDTDTMGLDDMNDRLAHVVDHATTQAGLMDEIMYALSGKAVPGTVTVNAVFEYENIGWDPLEIVEITSMTGDGVVCQAYYLNETIGVENAVLGNFVVIGISDSFIGNLHDCMVETSDGLSLVIHMEHYVILYIEPNAPSELSVRFC